MRGPMCKRVAQHELLLGCMMAQCGVDAGRAHQLERGQAYAAAVDRCLLCRAATECGLWLADKGNTEAPTFCPNLGYFRRCTTARPPS